MSNEEIKSILNEKTLKMVGMHAFEAGDPNKTGFVDLDTIKKLIKEFADGIKRVSPSEEFYAEMLKKVNKGSDGKFVGEDFTLIFKSYLEDLLK